MIPDDLFEADTLGFAQLCVTLQVGWLFVSEICTPPPLLVLSIRYWSLHLMLLETCHKAFGCQCWGHSDTHLRYIRYTYIKVCKVLMQLVTSTISLHCIYLHIHNYYM